MVNAFKIESRGIKPIYYMLYSHAHTRGFPYLRFMKKSDIYASGIVYVMHLMATGVLHLARVNSLATRIIYYAINIHLAHSNSEDLSEYTYK